jgi:hypothetical protein
MVETHIDENISRILKPELIITSYTNSRLHNSSFQPAGLHLRDEQREQAPAGRQQHHHDAHRQAKPNQPTHPNQTKPNQIKPNQTKPNRTNQTKLHQPNQPNPTQNHP